MLMQWNESLAIGVEEVDQQHKELINRVNQLLDACNQGKGKETVGEILKFLEDYVVTHFGAEEKLQRSHGYPDYQAHKELHDQFIRDFTGLKQQFQTEGATLRFVILTNRIVVDWLTKHIGRADKAFGEFLRAKNKV